MPWEATKRNLRMFRPFRKNAIDIRDRNSDTRLLLGYIEAIAPGTTVEGRVIELQGRSATGVTLEWSAGAIYNDAGTMPELETEFRGMTFNAIADRLYIPGGVRAVPDIGPFGDEAVCEPTQSLFSFFQSMASTAGLWAVPTSDGRLVFRKLGTGRPVVDLIEDESPLIAVSSSHDSTRKARWYLLATTQWGTPVSMAAVEDISSEPGVRGTRILPEPQQAATNYEELVRQARSRAIMDGYSVQATVTGFSYNIGSSWRTWAAGDIIRVYAPSAYILKPTSYIVRRATLQFDETGGETTVLDLGFPELFSGGVKREADYPWVG
jgi:prophage tail gpP-like protein